VYRSSARLKTGGVEPPPKPCWTCPASRKRRPSRKQSARRARRQERRREGARVVEPARATSASLLHAAETHRVGGAAIQEGEGVAGPQAPDERVDVSGPPLPHSASRARGRRRTRRRRVQPTLRPARGNPARASVPCARAGRRGGPSRWRAVARGGRRPSPWRPGPRDESDDERRGSRAPAAHRRARPDAPIGFAFTARPSVTARRSSAKAAASA